MSAYIKDLIHLQVSLFTLFPLFTSLEKGERSMENLQKSFTAIFAHEILSCNVNDAVYITGIVKKKWNRSDGGFGIILDDITGSVVVSFSTTYGPKKSQFINGTRVRIYATVAQKNDKQYYLKDVDHVDFLEEINKWSQDYDIMEQEALLLISKVSQRIRERLIKSNFVEVSARIISRHLDDDTLEPLLAIFPGYGAPAYLTPSPSSQLSEFLAVTLIPRVFASTMSITQSYRFPNGSSEIPIIMAKAINMDDNEKRKLILNTSSTVLKSLSGTHFDLQQMEGIWGEEVTYDMNREQNKFLYCTFSANIPTIGDKWNSVVNRISLLEDDQGNLLVETSDEIINEINTISTITFYPAQYLNWINKAPKRQLLNLWKLFDGGDIYE